MCIIYAYVFIYIYVQVKYSYSFIVQTANSIPKHSDVSHTDLSLDGGSMEELAKRIEDFVAGRGCPFDGLGGGQNNVANEISIKKN